MRILESFAFKDVLGETPPAGPEMAGKIAAEVQHLVENLADMNREDLEEVLAGQRKIKRDLDRLSGSMALPQSKVHLFIESIAKYISEIESKMGSGVSE